LARILKNTEGSEVELFWRGFSRISYRIEIMNENKEFKWLVLIYLLFAFSIGFLLAKTIYDDRPITKEELNELEKTEWYE